MLNVVFVIGNSPQISKLTDIERRVLDRYPAVFSLNAFVQHWQLAGFRPTHWQAVAHGPDYLKTYLTAIVSDEVLRRRLKTLIIGTAMSQMTGVNQWTLYHENIQAATRKVLQNYRQQLNELGINVVEVTTTDRMNEICLSGLCMPICFGVSTITALAQVAALTYPGAEVRIIGCERGDEPRHFYDPQPIEYPSTKEPLFIRDNSCVWWQDLHRLVERGIKLVDCCTHAYPLPCEFEHKSLLDGLDVDKLLFSKEDRLA